MGAVGDRVPRRRCVGCGRIAPKSELLRIVAVTPEGSGRTQAVADPLARGPGRGAYLCRAGETARAAASCLEQAERRGAIARALRRALPGGLALDDSKLVESMGP